MESVCLHEGERLDDLQNGYKIIQDKNDFCFGIDAVLLSWFAKARASEKVLDMCCGTGAIPLLMKSRNQEAHYTGLEIQEKSVQLARRSVKYNQIEDSVCIEIGDIKEATDRFGAASFDVITCNPPYMTANHGLPNRNDSKTIARHEILCTLEDVISQAAKVLKVKGHFYMIHRPFRLVEIIVLMTKYNLEPKRMQLVHSYVDKEPTMVLIDGCLGGNSRMTIEKPLIIYDKLGQYTKEIMNIYGLPKEDNHAG